MKFNKKIVSSELELKGLLFILQIQITTFYGIDLILSSTFIYSLKLWN